MINNIKLQARHFVNLINFSQKCGNSRSFRIVVKGICTKLVCNMKKNRLLQVLYSKAGGKTAVTTIKKRLFINLLHIQQAEKSLLDTSFIARLAS